MGVIKPAPFTPICLKDPEQASGAICYLETDLHAVLPSATTELRAALSPKP